MELYGKHWALVGQGTRYACTLNQRLAYLFIKWQKLLARRTNSRNGGVQLG